MIISNQIIIRTPQGYNIQIPLKHSDLFLNSVSEHVLQLCWCSSLGLSQNKEIILVDRWVRQGP